MIAFKVLVKVHELAVSICSSQKYFVGDLRLFDASSLWLLRTNISQLQARLPIVDLISSTCIGLFLFRYVSSSPSSRLETVVLSYSTQKPDSSALITTLPLSSSRYIDQPKLTNIAQEKNVGYYYQQKSKIKNRAEVQFTSQTSFPIQSLGLLTAAAPNEE